MQFFKKLTEMLSKLWLNNAATKVNKNGFYILIIMKLEYKLSYKRQNTSYVS